MIDVETSPAPSTESEARPGPTGGGLALALALAGAAVIAVLGWAYAPNLAQLVQTWSTHPDYSHGFLVVPVALIIFWQRRVGLRPADLSPSAWGWLLVVAALALRAYSYERGLEWTETATILPVIAGLVLGLGGRDLIGRAWPAIAYLAFALPLPARINALLSQPLQRLATLSSRTLLRFSGMWVMSEGNVLVVGGQRLEVAVACNGLSMLMTLGATVAAMVLLVPMPTWKRGVLLASIIPAAVVSNVLRIVATAWCYNQFGAEVGEKYAHDAAGWLMMPTALLLVGLEMAWLSWLLIEKEDRAPAIRLQAR